MLAAIKILLSALVIFLVSEIAKRSSLMASVLISLPLISIISFIWIYVENKDVKQIAEMSYSVLWLVIPSLIFFVALPILLKQGLSFWVSLAGSVAVTSAFYALSLLITAKFK